MANYKSYKQWLTRAEIKALDYIGSHRKSDVYPHRASCPVSVRTANNLRKKKLIMDMHENKNGKPAVMLTYHGERVFTEMHPYSKWRIK